MIGFVTEGPSDKSIVQEICRQLGIRTDVRRMRGNNFGKARALSARLFDAGCKKVIILKDLHTSTPSEIEGKFRGEGFQSQVSLCIVVKAIESWLLADEKALSDYLGSEVEAISNPEDISEPDELLEDIFRREKGRSYIKGGRDPDEIAKRLRLRIVEKKCPSFKEFKAAVRN